MIWCCFLLLCLWPGGFGQSQGRFPRLSFGAGRTCTYSYELAVHIARGSRSTESDGFQVHALVDVTSVSSERHDLSTLHLLKLDIREPRLRRTRGARVLVNHPVNEEFEDQLSKPFYFRQHEHGAVADVLIPKDESPQVAALKKGVAGAFQVNLEKSGRWKKYTVKEHDDSGSYNAEYKVLNSNESHAELHRRWTNHDYEEFADGTPVKGEHKVQSQHDAHVHVKEGKIHTVHRTNKAYFRPSRGHPRVENSGKFPDQDIEMSTRGYNKLTLRSCSQSAHHRRRRSVPEENSNTDNLKRENLIFKEADQIKWKDIGGKKREKTRPLYELIRCFTDESVKEPEVGVCSREINLLVRNSEEAFINVCNIIEQRSHDNITTWAVLISTLAWHGQRQAQDVLAHALRSNYPRPLSKEEYEALLEGIFYLPKGPIHHTLYDALMEAALKGDKHEDISNMAMLVLSGLSKRAKSAGYNDTLDGNVAELIHSSYRNKSTLYQADTEEHVSYLRDHIWAFGNLGHVSGLSVILEHADHDSSDIRSAVMSAMRKLPQEHTDHHLLKALNDDEHNEVKAAVVKVFTERHQDLNGQLIKALEDALWHAEDGDSLDSAVQELLENHGKHPKALYLTRKRSRIKRQKRAIVSLLRPREHQLRSSKEWGREFGGKWFGAEARIKLVNQVRLRVGIFGGSFEVDLDNKAVVRAHILKFGVNIIDAEATFKASASFKNDVPKDLIHTIADFGDNILKNVDSISNVIVEQTEKVKRMLMKCVPLRSDKFKEFVIKVNRFVKDLSKPLKPIEKMDQVISYTKDVLSRLKKWKWMLKEISNIQSALDDLSSVDKVFSQSFAGFDGILKILYRITVYLPHNLPTTFRIEELFRRLQGVSVESHSMKIANYFESLGFQTPRGFELQLPFKHLIRYTFSLEQFQKVSMRLLNFANKFLDLSSLLDALKIMRLPKLHLSELESRLPTSEPQRGFQFGLDFDWKRGLRFDLDLKSTDFKQFLSTLSKFSGFFTQFTVPGFNLDKFFDDILPGKTGDLSTIFEEIFQGALPSSTTDPAKILQDLLKHFTSTIDSSFGSVTAISDLAQFFRKLGPEMVDFSEKSSHKLCSAYRLALNFSYDFTKFGGSIWEPSIRVLQEMDRFTEVSLNELMNFTLVVDSLADEIERNFKDAALQFTSKSIQDLNPKLQEIQKLAVQVVDFTNGTTSKVTGACSKTADFSANIIDAVQEATHKAIWELDTFIGPIATDVSKVGEEVKTAVAKVKTWYKENMSARAGKILRVAKILSDVLAIIHTKKGFIGTVREVNRKINEVLLCLKNLPEFSRKVQKAADDIINFSQEATTFKTGIKKLNLQQKLGIQYDQKIKDTCAKFEFIARDTIGRLGSFNVVEEVSTLFTKESERFISKAVSKLRLVKKPVHKIQGEIKSLRDVVREVMNVLVDLKSFTQNFSPVLTTVSKLPNCKKLKAILVESTAPCVKKALSIGKYTLGKLKELRKDVLILHDMVPLTWKNIKAQKCIKGTSCISDYFIDQARNIKDKTDFLVENLQEASGFSDMLQRCKLGVQNMTAVVDTIRILMVQVNNFSLRDDFVIMKSTLQRVTGRSVQNSDQDVHVKRRSAENAKIELQRIVDYVEKAKEIQEEIKLLVESSFKTMRSVYDDPIDDHLQKIKNVRKKLKVPYELWKKIKDASSVLQELDFILKRASDYASNLKEVTTSLSGTIVDLSKETGRLHKEVKPYLKYAKVLEDATDMVNGFPDKVTDFLNKLQLRQRGLSLSDYKPWDQYPYCSESVCVRSIRRSSPLYYSTIFVHKFPHLDDLSSMDGTGRWLVPGLFDDFKVQGISQLSENMMLLGMHGVVRNKGKASLLVVTNLRNGGSVEKIIQLGRASSPFSVTIGGVAIARNVIWISDSKAPKIYRVWKRSVTSSLSSLQPSWITVSGEISVEGLGSSVSYDRPSNFLWVTDGKAGKSYGYQLSENGDLIDFGATPDKVIHVSKGAQGLSIIRQFGDTYACVSICEMLPGFQCKLEFHDISSGLKTSEDTLSRVVRTPSGLESVQMVDSLRLVVAFSSGTFSDKEKIAQIGGDYEDRYFRMKLPILKTDYEIHKNCLKLKVLSDWIIRPQKVFPIGEMHCGSRRKRSSLQGLLDSDVYSEELEQLHGKTSRKRRDISDLKSCVAAVSDVKSRYTPFFPELSRTFPVMGIPVRVSFGAGGTYVLYWHGQFCMKDKTVRFGLIPGAWITTDVSVSLSLLVIEVGATLEVTILSTKLLPELTVKIDRWPLQACVVLKMHMIPLQMRVYVWFRFIKLEVKVWLFGISVKFGWYKKNTRDIWSWSARAIERELFRTCNWKEDLTRPTVGTCNAKQVSDTKFFVQWHGFHEDTSIKDYRVRIGSIEGSGDDFGAWAGTTLSMVVSGLSIMHGRDVYVSVFATNAQGMDSQLAKCSKFVAKRRSPKVHYVYDGADAGNDLDYQSDDHVDGMKYLLKSRQEEVTSVQWGISSSPSCTLEGSETDIQPMTSLGDSTVAQASGLQLNHGSKYYTRVLVTNKLGQQTIACSDGLVIDTTPPIPTYVWDGAGEEDTDFIPSTTRFRARFAPFYDPESPMAKYEWRLMMKDSDTAVTPFKDIPLKQTSPLMENLFLTPGVSYYSVLRGTNSAGLQTSINSNGFVPDNTPPFCLGRVIDVSNRNDTNDADFVRELKSIQAKWECTDNESGIKKQIIGLGTYPGGDDVVFFFNTSISQENGKYFFSFRNLTIRPKVRYHVTVKVFNGAKLKRTITSDGILLDSTPPAVAAQYIKDGSQGRDKNFTSERFSFSAHWEKAFSDAESGLVDYHVGLGTQPGLDDTKKFTNVGSSTRAELKGLLLESGRRYYVTVMGCNAVGMCTNGSSNGAVVDFVPPSTGDVITGYQGPPQYYQWLTKSAWARWDWCLADENRDLKQTDYHQCSNDSFYDLHSGIAGFGISVVSLTTDVLLAPIKEVGRVRVTGRSFNMRDGIYSVFIEARDHAGVRSRGLSNTFIVDSSPPVITHVQHGVSGDPVQYTNAHTLLFKASFEIEDDLSKITEYKVGIGSYPGADDVISYQSFRLPFALFSLRANWTSGHALYVEDGRHYFVTVWTINGAGLFAIKSSLPLQVDFDPPSGGIVMDGWNSYDAQYHSYPSIYRVHWRYFTDISGIQDISVGISSYSDCNKCDIQGFVVTQPVSDYHVFTGLNLISGMKYYACVKLTDKVGNEGTFPSNGVLVDTTPPVSGEVTDGRPGEDREVQTEGSILRATWNNFTEQETAIVSYKLAFGTTPGSSDIQDFTDVGLVTSSASSRLKVSELTSGQRYYASVVAYNVLGVPSAVTSSNGVLVDSTPPIFTSKVYDGLDPKADLQSISADILSVTWHCEDPETSVDNIQVAFGLQPGGSDVVNFTTLASNQKTFSVQTALRSGYRYFATVRCVNKVGLRTLATSDGVVYDTTPPKGLFIVDGDYQASTLNVSLKWKFVDPTYKIQQYVVYIFSQAHDTNAQGPFTYNGSVTSSTINLVRPLHRGVKYYLNVTAVNLAGLKTTLDSDGFTVDSTPAVCDQVWDGDKSYQHDVQYVPKTNKMTVSWNCHDDESSITLYRYSVKSSITGEVILPFHAIKMKVNSSRTVVITGEEKWAAVYKEGGVYTVGIELTNGVQMKSVYWTNGVVVDSTPPTLKDLKLSFNPKTDSLYAMWKAVDQESGLKRLAWGIGTAPDSTHVKNFTEVTTSTTNISITNIPLSLGRTYFLSLIAINKAGLSSTTASNGVVIDRTAPTTGIVATHYVFPKSYDRSKNFVSGASFVAAWTGFIDSESGVHQYSWAVGTNPQDIKQKDDSSFTVITDKDSVGGTVIENQTLSSNTTYFVCIRATNGAGLQRTDCSLGMLVIFGKFSPGAVNDGPVTSARDIDFQMDDKAIWAHWDDFNDPFFDISRYDWCIGDQPPRMFTSSVCQLPYMEIQHLKTSAHRFHNLTLSHGTKYYVTVKAENTRGEKISSTSDGVTVDRTPPVGKAIHVSPATGTLYVTSSSAPVVTWSMEDPESGIRYFLVGVGSFPQQDDVMSFNRVSRLSRSVDLDTLNLTLSEGLSFYVTVTGVNMLGLATTLTSQQILVDWSPPVAGHVVDGNETSPEGDRFVDIDYQREGGALSGHWDGFEDPESDVVDYRWCIGTNQGKCDIQELTANGLETSFHHPVALQEGLRYYVTIEATNGAGLKENVYSDGVTLDASPPVVGNINFEAAIQSDAHEILFSWTKVTDEESGVSELAWCAGTSAGKDDLLSWIQVDSSKWSVTYSFSKPLTSGTSIFITLKAWNGAGMTSQITSGALVIDSTPPEQGNVIVGNTPGLIYLRQGEAIKVEWSGFADAESGVRHYEWAVCYSFSTDDCVTPYVYVGKETSVTNDALDLKLGVSYVFVVRAYNQVYLFTDVVSNSFILNSKTPHPGSVFDGDEIGKDISVQSSTSYIWANWQPFSDLHGKIGSYEICVGNKPEICDIRGFINVGINLAGTISGLQLNHTGQYFVTIQATNAAGYQEIATSNGVRIDSTPPVGKAIRDGQTLVDIELQHYDSFISANWDECEDPESGIDKYEWCAGTKQGSCDVIAQTDVGESTTVQQQVSPPLTAGMKVFVTLTVYNEAGGVTKLFTNGVTIDNAAPVISKVLDLQINKTKDDIDFITAKDQYCMSWNATDLESGVGSTEVSVCSTVNPTDCLVQSLDAGNRTEFCMADLQFTEGVEYTAIVRVTNNVGISSEMSSDGFMVDSTEPYIGEVLHFENKAVEGERFTHSVISVKWDGFEDKESGVSKYLCCVGTRPGDCSVRNFTEIINKMNFSFTDSSLQHGVTYFVAVVAENHAGLKSAMTASDGVTVDRTGPVGGQHVFDGGENGADIDIQQSARNISANWNGLEDPESDVIEVTWCAGTAPGKCDLVTQTQIEPSETSVHRVLDEPLITGQRYYVTVQATNGAGVMTTITSDGVTVDTTPPLPGQVIDGDSVDVDFVYGEDDVTARWFNFSDPQSGVQFYEVAVCDVRNVSRCPQAYVYVGQTTNVTITGLDLENGVQYMVKVRAKNPVGLQTEASSDGFTVDFSPPSVGKVWEGFGIEDVKYQFQSSQFNASWLPFLDQESGIVTYEVCLGVSAGICDILNMVDVGSRLSYSFNDLNLSHAFSYYATVRGTNAIGLSSVMSSNGVLIDLTPPRIIEENNVFVNTTLHPPLTATNSTNAASRYYHVRFTCSSERLSAEWQECEDPESEIQGNEWCVGTAAAECDILPMTSTGLNQRASAIVKNIPFDTGLFASVYVINGVGLKVRLFSNTCTVNSVPPNIIDVHDATEEIFDGSDVDWKAITNSLSMRWKIIEHSHENRARMRIQMAITHPSPNISRPRLLRSRSWQGEPIVQDFVDMLPWQRNVTIITDELEAYQRYKSVIRVSNGDDIFAEKASDGIRIEPDPPAKRKLLIKDSTAKNERTRLWPLLHLPPVNKSAIDPEIMYISSPETLVLEVQSSGNATDSTAPDESLSKEFQVFAVRANTNESETNSKEERQLLRTFPAFANPEGPCCANISLDRQTIFSDMHVKPTLPSQSFGSSVALLSDDYLVVTSSGRAHLFSVHDGVKFYSTMYFNSSKVVGLAQHGNRTAFLCSSAVHVYDSTRPTDIVKLTTIDSCKIPFASNCSNDQTWADSLQHVFGIRDHVVAIRGRLSSTNSSVVGIFREHHGIWKFGTVLGHGERESSFGRTLSLNERLIAIASDRRNSSCVFVYQISSYRLIRKICFNNTSILGAHMLLHLTETNAIIIVSKERGSVAIFQLDVRRKSYNSICYYETQGESLSGSLDTVSENNQVIVALGIQTLSGKDGVRLIGFDDVSNPSSPGDNTKRCNDLGRVITPGSRLRVDDGVPRASVSFRGNRIVFGVPSVLTWPDLSEGDSTGRVYITTYCPRDHVRSREPGVGFVAAFTCRPCENGRRSFGGFVTECSVCENRTCPSSITDNSTFEIKLCDFKTCPSSSSLDNTTWGITTKPARSSFFVDGVQNVYSVELLEITRANISTASYSESFIIDSTPPTLGTVYDGLGSDQNANCSQNETFGEDSQCSRGYLRDTDVDYTNNTAEIHAWWIDFLDNQSDIIEYFWCVGSRPMRDDIRECESTGLRSNGSHYGLSLQQNETYYVTVVACNGAHRCSAAYSDGVTIDTTPPVMEYVRDGIMGPDMDFQAFLDLIFAYYYGSDLDSGIRSYEVAWGTAPNMTNIKEFEEVVNTTVWYARIKDGGLEKGKRYYASVRATNGAGLLSDIMSSNGIMVGKSEYIFDNRTFPTSFFFDTVDVNLNGTREDGGVGATYGTLDVPEGAVKSEVKLRCYSLDERTQQSNVSDEGPISDTKRTTPKQFKFGNYSFQIKALDPETNTVQEGYRFEKPITVSMFYDVNNLIKANKKVVNDELEKEDIDPVLYLWDPKNESWFDASLTCPEPWSHVNRSIKLLTVHVCHLTQFAFFWSFRAQYGLMLFNKNSSVYDEFGQVRVTRKANVTKLELPIKRAKGSSGNVTVTWSLLHDTSDASGLVWPSSGIIQLREGQWNSSIVVNVADEEIELSERVIWVQLGNTTGGAVLAARDQTRTKLVITSNVAHRVATPGSTPWVTIGATVGSVILLGLIVVPILVPIRR